MTKINSTCIIASTPRTGSLLLCYGMEDTKIAGRPAEFFSPILYEHWVSDWKLPPDFSIQDYFRASLAYGTTSNGVHSVKIHYRHLRPMAREFNVPNKEDVLSLLYPQAKFVNIIRRDIRAQAISLFKANATQEWHITSRFPKSRSIQPEFNKEAILDLEEELQKEQESWDCYFSSRNIKPLIVEYEVLARNYREEIARVLDYLELDNRIAKVLPPTRLVKQSDGTSVNWRNRIDQSLGATSLYPSKKSQKDIIIIDDFYEDPNAVRNYALQQDYYTPYESTKDIVSGLKKSTWWGMKFKEYTDCPFKSSPLLIETFESLTGEKIDMEHWCASYPVDEEWKPVKREQGEKELRSCLWNCCFHVKPDVGQRLGNGVHSHTDADSWNASGENGWAGIIYLNPSPPVDGGLYLWRNRDPDHQFDWMTPAGNWQLVDKLGNVFNRLILCRGKFPHSGANGWGDSTENGRMFQTFFFRTLR